MEQLLADVTSDSQFTHILECFWLLQKKVIAKILPDNIICPPALKEADFYRKRVSKVHINFNTEFMSERTEQTGSLYWTNLREADKVLIKIYEENCIFIANI